MLRDGDLKFVVAGEKLKGSWVLVRMAGDRYGGKRTNWLLIKHRDKWAKSNAQTDVLKKDRSVASGRTMNADRGGQGREPERVHERARAFIRAGCSVEYRRQTSDARTPRISAHTQQC
jgi:bifunctional non-homologous end joining protein LigD